MSEDYVEVFVRVERSVMTALKERLGLELSTEVVQEALTMINWAADEKMKGRVILSATEEGFEVVQLAMECLKA